MIEVVASQQEAAQQTSADQPELPHILFVVDQFGKTLGGGERIALKLAALLPQYGYQASILTFLALPESAALKAPPCTIYQLPLRRTFDFTALQAAFELRRFLKRKNIRIVHTFFESSDIWAGLVTRTMSNARLVWARRDMGILRTRKHRIAYRLLAGAPDAVFAVSEQVRRHAIEVDRIDPARVQTIYNGLNLGDWHPASRRAKAPGEFLITTVGNVRRVKGHDVLIKAAAKVVERFPKVSFTIAGEVLEPDYFSELQSLVQSLRLANHVRFDGGISNLPEYLAAADVFVLPSRSEGFSNAIIESMAASLPVVATNVGGNSEAVEAGISGLLVPSDDPGALAEALLKLLYEPSQASAMGAAGRNLVAEKFTIEVMMTQVACAYSKLLSQE